ncbi:DUF4942 domain-containing protein [Albibacterium profundi]|uniref:DUF4942 domain-containing protein n=1 Tax=Albibacterium profundi TaxID=3134906 RepID=A0ABV5CIA1_9SPHI
MFNQDFYPTPDQVIETMLAGIDLSGKTVLEPSSGKGNIIQVLKNRGAKVLCCEKDPQLAILSSNQAKLLKHDFLEVESHEISHIDYIIMNPPFSADEKHINHAWSIAPDGCEIIALCNYSTLSNNYTRSRNELLSIIEGYGTKTNIGDCFSSSERKTGVEIGLIKLIKPGIKSNGFDDFFTDESDDPEKQENGLMSYNAVREIVQRYVNAVKLYDDVLENAVKMNALTEGLKADDLVFTCSQNKVQVTRNEFAKDLQKRSWKWIINKMNLEKYSTRGLMEDINKFVEDQTKMKFTMKNIYLMLDAIVQTTDQRMDKALVEVFDGLTKHYHENRYSVEGWKTNSHYLVNKKFIMPYIAPLSRWGTMDVNYRQAELLDDFNKALCFLTGSSFNVNDRFSYRVSESKPGYGEWFEWTFFEVKLFKKGTGHFKFKDENVWALFNQQIARIKGFPLPENLKKAA